MTNIIYSTPEPPMDIVRRLRQVDERLGLRWVPYRTMDYGNMNETAYWAITLNWHPEDRRFQLVQRGDMPDTHCYDILVMLPPDCSVDEADGFFQKSLRDRQKGVGDVEGVISRLHRWNDSVKKEAMKETKELAEELIETNAGTLFREEGKTTAKVYQSGTRPQFPPGKKKIL